jgi:hypothetical protein
MSIKNLMQSKLNIEELNKEPSGFRIAARQKGLMAWIASLLGMGTTNHMSADTNGLSFETTSFSGNERAYIPMDHVSATVYKYGRPVWMLIIGLAGLGYGVVNFLVGTMANSREAEEFYMMGFLAVVIGVVFFVAYKMAKKTVTIGVLSDAGTADALQLEASDSQVEELLAMSQWLEQAAAGTVDTASVPTPPAPADMPPAFS